MARLDANRIILPTSCYSCFIEITHTDPGDEWKSVEVLLLSDHLPVENWSWRGFNGRLRRAWRALRGDRQWFVDFDTAEQLAAFSDALADAGREAFGA